MEYGNGWMRSQCLNQTKQDLNTGSTSNDVGQIIGLTPLNFTIPLNLAEEGRPRWVLYEKRGLWLGQTVPQRKCTVVANKYVNRMWEWISGHLFWAVHGSLRLLTLTPCSEGLGNWNFPPLPALGLSSLSQPMPGAESCPRILGPAPNHRSWHRVQSLQANTSLSQPAVLSPTICRLQFGGKDWTRTENLPVLPTPLTPGSQR